MSTRGKAALTALANRHDRNLFLTFAVQSLFRAAERKYSGVTESLEAHSVEGQKLQQRLAAAQEQYDTGLRKCIATAKQISALQSRVSGLPQPGSDLFSF